MTYHLCYGCGSIWFGGSTPGPEHDGCWRCRDRMTNVRPEIAAAMVVEEKMRALCMDVEKMLELELKFRAGYLTWIRRQRLQAARSPV